MNKKKKVFAAVIIIGVIVAGLFLYGHDKNTSPAYQALGAQCPSGIDHECCMESAERITKGNYTQISEYLDACPEGYKHNTLKCSGSLSWCEPIKG